MRGVWVVIALLTAASAACAQGAAAAAEDSGTLVREVVYNELHDHNGHGFWRYWVQHSSRSGNSLEEEVETADGPIARQLMSNGHPLDGQGALEEQARLQQLLSSPSEQANRREAYQADEQRIGRILAMFPGAFLYEDAGEQDGVRHLRFTPNPTYSAHNIESRVFHCLSGDLWIDLRTKRMKRLEGRLNQNVEFGFGLLGRVDKGSWFRMVRTQVSPSEWKTAQFELHMNGRALMFKTLAHNTSEQRGGFAAVPPRMSLAQGLAFLENSAAVGEAAARMAPAALSRER